MVPLITDRALDDLNALWDELNAFNREYANRTIESLVDNILRLDQFPEAHPVVSSEGGFAIRRLNVGVWAVFYAIEQGRPTVIRVVSGRRDLGPILANLDPPTT